MLQRDAAARKTDAVRIKSAGGYHARYILYAEYAPGKGTKKYVMSNHPRCGMTWATKEEITDADKLAFVEWINTKLARGGSNYHIQGAARVPPPLASRSSMRVDAVVMQKHAASLSDAADVERAVLQCVKYLIHNVVHRARHSDNSIARTRINFVPGKARQNRTKVITTSFTRTTGLTKRMRAAKRLTQRRSRGYSYRLMVLKRAAASRSEEDLGWLETNSYRLKTLIARQDIHKLLPEGEAPAPSVHPSVHPSVKFQTR